MPYTVMIFMPDKVVSTQGSTVGEALTQAQKEVGKTVTYRPSDGTVYVDYHIVPCGVIFQKGYLPQTDHAIS